MSIDKDMAFVESVCGKCKHYEDEDDKFCLGCKKMDKAMRRLTHHELCILGARWVFNETTRGDETWRILMEPGYREELPDVFAFTRNYSTLIECKASRADFLADRKKPFRQNPLMGIGMRRYYLVNEGVAKQEEMPPGWQLLIAYDKNTILLPADYFPPAGLDLDKRWDFDIRNATNETELMWSWEYRRDHNCLPDFPIERPNMIHPGYWMQEGWLEKNIPNDRRDR